MPRRPPIPLLLALALLAACSGERPAAPNVVLIVVDTLRADRLGSHGNPRGLTPHLDRLAAEGVQFENAQAHAPWTLPSVASLLTSLHPVQHGAGGSLDLSALERGGAATPRFRALSPEVETLPERFRANGYRTASVVNVDFLGTNFGLARGFDTCDEQWYGSNDRVRPATETTDAALRWIDRGGRGPFFLLVHYFDPHAVYDPPPEYRRRFAAPQDRESNAFVFGTREHMLLLRSGRLVLDPALIERAARLYDGEVAYVDAQIGRLLAELERRGQLDNSIVVVTSDHGEEFLDHGGFEHGHTLYQELTHVPLILSAPGRLAPARVATRVGLIDVGPTLCELAGIAPPATAAGRSLVPWARGAGPGPAEPVLAHGNFWGPALESLIVGPHKLILPADPAGAPEVFDLERDARETTDLVPTRGDLVSLLVERFGRARERLAREARGVEVELDPARLDLLRTLGYAGEDPEGPR